MSTDSVTCHSHRYRDSSPPTLVTDTYAGMGAQQKKKLAKYVAVDRLLLQKAHTGVEVRGVPAYLRSSETFPAHDTILALHS